MISLVMMAALAGHMNQKTGAKIANTPAKAGVLLFRGRPVRTCCRCDRRVVYKYCMCGHRVTAPRGRDGCCKDMLVAVKA